MWLKRVAEVAVLVVIVPESFFLFLSFFFGSGSTSCSGSGTYSVYWFCFNILSGLLYEFDYCSFFSIILL